ncbi:MATE family efflux transporter [Patescibacteria group bacterium]
MKSTENPQLIEGPVRKTLIHLTIPMIFGMLGMVAFNLADTYFVGQLGTNELAALSFTFPVVMLIISLSIGIGIGASAVVSKAIGRRDTSNVKRLTTDTLILSFLLVVFFAIAGILTIDPLFGLLGAEPEIIELIHEYIFIWYLGTIFVIIPMVGNSVIRATGDTKTPSIIMIFAVTVNLILDPILIFGLGPIPMLGLKGAAIATLISRATTFAVAAWVLFFREKMISLKLPTFSQIIQSWKSVLYIGLPTALTRMILPLGMGVIFNLLAIYGTEAVAAFGVAARIEFFGLTVIFALATVIGPFVGQNIAAHKLNRVKTGIKHSEQFSIYWGLIMIIIFAASANLVAPLFNDNPLVISSIIQYMWIVPVGYGLYGVMQISTASLNVLHKPFHAAALTLFQMFVLIIPLAYLGSYFFGLIGIFAAVSVSFIVSGIVSHFVLMRILKKA